MHQLIKHDNISAVKWIIEHDMCKTNSFKSYLEQAVKYNNLDILKILHARDNHKYSSIVDLAIRYGHIDILKWLHNIGHFISKNAMDEAAKYNHLEIIKWLHFNRQEGCTSAAMDNAIQNGHLKIAKWLYENRIEGCSRKGLANPPAKMIEWLKNTPNVYKVANFRSRNK